MPKCKYCHGNITKFDKERCPICGALNPLEKNYQETSDITQVIDKIEEEEKVIYTPHSYKINAILIMFLGIFGADAFYLGFIKKGIIRLIVNIAIIAGLFCLFFFLKVYSFHPYIFSGLTALGILFVIYLIIGIIFIFKKPIKDANGVFLK